MEDAAIVDLYWQRSEQAIPETDRKYGPYCHTIAYNICTNHEDAEECVNDTWFRAWNLMPDKRPSLLSAFLGAGRRPGSVLDPRSNTDGQAPDENGDGGVHRLRKRALLL